MRPRSLQVILLLPLLVALTTLPAGAQRGDDTKRKSKNGSTEGSIGGVSIRLDYGRPNVNGRQIWGGLVPYDSVWRTGADEATTITFSEDVRVQGEPLAAGTYCLFTIPGETEWTIIFNEVAKQWGAFSYDQDKDVLRVTAAPRTGEHVESMDFVIDGAAVVLRWEKLEVPFEIAPAG